MPFSGQCPFLSAVGSKKYFIHSSFAIPAPRPETKDGNRKKNKKQIAKFDIKPDEIGLGNLLSPYYNFYVSQNSPFKEEFILIIDF